MGDTEKAGSKRLPGRPCDQFHSRGAEQRKAAAAVTLAADHARPLDFPSKHTDDYCAICAAMAFLASSFVPQLLVLPLPVVATPIERHVARVISFVIAPQRTPLRSRAPPLA